MSHLERNYFYALVVINFLLAVSVIGSIAGDWYHVTTDVEYDVGKSTYDLYRNKYTSSGLRSSVYYVNESGINICKFFIGIGFVQYLGLVCFIVSAIALLVSYRTCHKRALNVNRIFVILMSLFEIISVISFIAVNKVFESSGMCSYGGSYCDRFFGSSSTNGYTQSWGPSIGWFFGLVTIFLCIFNNSFVSSRYKEIHKHEHCHSGDQVSLIQNQTAIYPQGYQPQYQHQQPYQPQYQYQQPPQPYQSQYNTSKQ
ncbi:hypothetical protein PPL_06455 [Heterostelium album PN500]|uniref:Uncharacterized protein n=1 Tax=Heterostelium pallidum (strain ATCC 26659 / Pp 5 / PN500) TaxID=670386 RepID=D3BD74_HETP5|nr:hypothetical protein PPL_06455 [Heterostelium album PN500]EFA80866.1 hypothetical protein PPL_06455 [Heterostelium album PN500]|eukprot:XP_020432985.1 hypothetical protein PPL_06455 [Heterostelium album PN500]